MRRRKVVAFVLMVMGVALLATATTSFSAVSAERGVSVGVASESNAYFVVQTSDTTVTTEGPEDVELGSITNNFAGKLTDVDVTVSDGAGPPSVSDVYVSQANPLGSGHTGYIEATVSCGGTYYDVDSVTLDIEATGASTEVSTSREVEVTCDVPTPTPEPESDDDTDATNGDSDGDSSDGDSLDDDSSDDEQTGDEGAADSEGEDSADGSSGVPYSPPGPGTGVLVTPPGIGIAEVLGLL